MPFIDNLVTRYENGVTNRDVGDIFNSLKLPDPTRLHTYYEDFDYYLAADWVVTEVGVATQVLQDADGGRLLITNAGADDNSSFQNKVGESFLFALGTPAFFRALLQVSDATQSDFIMGLQITDTTPLAVTDGVFFRKDDGDANLDFVAIKDSVAVESLAVFTVLDATDLEVAFYWDGIDRIWFAVNGTALGFITPGVSLPDDEVLTISFGIQNGEAAIKTMAVDFVYAAMER
jgi:hypothetical protein